MASVKASDYKDHSQRTATEPRDNSLHAVKITKITPATPTINIIHLTTSSSHPAIHFLPGQWVDTFTLASEKPGGFTITSSPSRALPSSTTSSAISSTIPQQPYIELAIQNSPTNPPAAYFHKPPSDILGQEIHIRTGGSFVWPHAPPTTAPRDVRRYVFLAGGVGVNPLISIVSHLSELCHEGRLRLRKDVEITFLYAVRWEGGIDGEGEDVLNGAKILFLERLSGLFASSMSDDEGVVFKLKLFMTRAGEGRKMVINGKSMLYESQRVEDDDVLQALGPVSERAETVVYVCAKPDMTDHFVALAKKAEGMKEANVLSEKWW